MLDMPTLWLASLDDDCKSLAFARVSWLEHLYSLPEPEYVSLAVRKIGGKSHAANRLLSTHHSTAERFDPRQRLVDVLHLNRDDRTGDGVLPGQHPTVDRAWFDRGTVLPGRGRPQQGVAHARHAVDRPAERSTVEVLRPLEIVRWKLEMNDAICHRFSSFSRPPPFDRTQPGRRRGATSPFS